MINNIPFILMIVGLSLILSVICLAVIVVEHAEEQSNQCRSVGGYPIVDRGQYKFCVNKNAVIETSK